MQVQDDRYYIDQVLNGDIRAFSVLVERHKGLIYSYALRMMKSPLDAEEVAHDAFVKAYQSLRSFKHQCRFSTWLYRIAHNESISRLRKKKHETLSLDEPNLRKIDIEETDHSLDEIPEEEQQRLVRHALSLLPDDERSIISLYYLQECSVKEISGITGYSEANIKIKLFRARKKLWEKLGNQLKEQLHPVYEKC